MKRSYGDGCAIAHGLDLVGDRWALLIVRDLLLGPKRFTDLEAGLPGAGPNMLAQRLRDLEQAGAVRRATLPPPAASKVYELTEWGLELEPVVTGLGRWAAVAPEPPAGPVGADSWMLTLRTYFRPSRSNWTTMYDVRLGRDRYAVHVSAGSISVRRGRPDRADVVLDTDPDTFGTLLGSGRKLTAAVRTRRATVTGDPTLARRLLDAVTVP